ncbi:MAG: hypothetical protein WC243_01250 [Patescibacteria group bacterium]
MKTKMQVQEEYNTALSNFEEKEALVAGLLNEIQTHTTQIDKLNVSIPDRPQEERYLIELSLQAARAGYELKGFSISKVSPTVTEVMATLEGPMETINNLTTAITSMERLSEIDSIEAKRERDDSVVVARIKVFNYSNKLQ